MLKRTYRSLKKYLRKRSKILHKKKYEICNLNPKRNTKTERIIRNIKQFKNIKIRQQTRRFTEIS